MLCDERILLMELPLDLPGVLRTHIARHRHMSQRLVLQDLFGLRSRQRPIEVFIWKASAREHLPMSSRTRRI